MQFMKIIYCTGGVDKIKSFMKKVSTVLLTLNRNPTKSSSPKKSLCSNTSTRTK